MKKLGDYIDDTKAGFHKGQPGRTAHLVKREGDVAMYKRDDKYYEIGYIKSQKEHDVVIGGKDVHFEEKENYWNPEDFGIIASTTSNAKRAEEIYKHYLGHRMET